MTQSIAEVKSDHGKIMVRLDGMVRGAWLEFDSPIDSVIAHVQRELGLKRRNVGVIIDAIYVDAACLTRCRQGVYKSIPEHWLMRLQDFSGIPVDELRIVANIVGNIGRHPNARKIVSWTPAC